MPDVKSDIKISIIIPVYNEAGNLHLLQQALLPVIASYSKPTEVIYVDDGSSDSSVDEVTSLIQSDSTGQTRLIQLSRNYGQTTAFMAGIDQASGEIIILMDADMQNDPADIPHLLNTLEQGFDVVSGWRKDRKDPFVTKRLPSWIANKFISFLSGVSMHDYGCSLKAYRKNVISGFRLYGEMHRFIPIYAHWQGALITEIPVTHHPRKIGTSNYGLSRTFKVIMDLIVVIFLHEYQQKPMYVFGTAALFSLGISTVAGTMALYYKFFENTSLIQTPLPLLCVMCFITAVMCFLMGLLAELLIRIYYESQDKRTYSIGRSTRH
jgi:glycosyltransferase involved in cell wall biosynthesis